MPRYVILEHDHPHLHWDLMLETGEVLRTWRLASLPEPTRVVTATELGDHRKAYLGYEGPVSRGRGTVLRRDRGQFDWVAVDENCVKVRLYGERNRGQLILRRRVCDDWTCEMEILADSSGHPISP